MAISCSMTWIAGTHNTTGGGFTLTDDKGVVHQHALGNSTIDNISNPVFRAIADELHNQAGSATGTVVVSIA